MGLWVLANTLASTTPKFHSIRIYISMKAIDLGQFKIINIQICSNNQVNKMKTEHKISFQVEK